MALAKCMSHGIHVTEMIPSHRKGLPDYVIKQKLKPDEFVRVKQTNIIVLNKRTRKMI